MPPWRIWQARSRNLAKAAKDFGIDLPIQSAATRRASAARRPSATAGQEASLPAAEGIVREIAFAHYSFYKAGSSRCRGHQRCSTANVRRSAARGTRGCSPVQPDAPPQTAAPMAFGGDRRSLTVGAGQGERHPCCWCGSRRKGSTVSAPARTSGACWRTQNGVEALTTLVAYGPPSPSSRLAPARRSPFCPGTRRPYAGSGCPLV
jgi:hypothetical protein